MFWKTLKYKKTADIIGEQTHRQIRHAAEIRSKVFVSPEQILYFSGYIDSLIFTALNERGCSDRKVILKHIKYVCDHIMPDRLWDIFQKGYEAASLIKKEEYECGVDDGLHDYGKIEDGIPPDNLFKFLTKGVIHDNKPDTSNIKRHENNKELETIFLPDVGDFKDIDVIDVFVSIGDIIKAEDSLITLESDKATMEIPSPIGGVVEEIYVNVGDKISQGLPICSVRNADKKKP
jgi:biotin carboxyl carrier protein